MPQAKITINAVVGSNDDLPINVVVQLGNQNTGGELTFFWEILDQPDGPADTLSSTTLQNPTFVPTKEGTYLLRLTVNQSLVTEKVDQVIAAVRQLKTRLRVPAAGETNENGTDGWASPNAANTALQLVDAMRADPGIEVCYVADGTVTTECVVMYRTAATIKTGLPGQETLLAVYRASALNPVTEPFGYVVGSVDGGVIGVGSLVYVRRFGVTPLKPGFPLPSDGDTIYLNDTGDLSDTPGTNSRALGVWASVSDEIAYFDGSQQTASGGVSPSVGTKYWLESTDNITVPNRYQYLVQGAIIIDPGGSLVAAPGGQIVVIP